MDTFIGWLLRGTADATKASREKAAEVHRPSIDRCPPSSFPAHRSPPNLPGASWIRETVLDVTSVLFGWIPSSVHCSFRPSSRCSYVGFRGARMQLS